MSVFKRTATPNNSWTAAGTWTLVSGTGTYPSTSADQAIWDSTSTSAGTVAQTVTTGQLLYQNPPGAASITVNGTLAVTIDPSGGSFGGVGIDMSSATQNFSVQSYINLGSSQEWTVASGRTLSVTGIITATGTKNLTLSGTGTKTLSGASTGWANSTVTVAAGQVNASNINALGAASNSVVVNTGANLTFSANPAQTAFSISGTGTSAAYGAIFASSAVFAATKTITFASPGSALSIAQGTAFLGKLDVASGITDVSINIWISSPALALYSATMATASTYSAAVTLTGYTSTGTPGYTKFSIGTANGASDLNNGLGANANNVTVNGPAGGGLSYSPASSSNTGTFSRNYTFVAGPRHNYGTFWLGTAGTAVFTGTVTLSGTSSDYVQFFGPNINTGYIKFTGTVTGAANMDVGGSTSFGAHDGTAVFAPGVNIAGWTGTLETTHVQYGVNITNDVVFNNTTAVFFDNISGGPLTVAHKSYTKLPAGSGTMQFTGTNPLTFSNSNGGNWSSAPGTWQVDASTLTLAFNITGSGGLTKNGTGTLVLSGNNSGLTSVSLLAGTLVLNSANAAGPSASTFLFQSTGTTLDSTTGVSLNQNGAINLGASAGGFTWAGTADLAFGTGAVTHGGSRTITFVNGATGMLTFAGTLNSPPATYLWNIGGGVAGAKNIVYFANTNASTATTGQVTAGYLRAGNAASLGAVGTTTTWTVSSGAAIELIGSITIPATKSFTGLGAGAGPNTNGVLRSVSGVNKWQGGISFASATGARIQVDAGTFTLDPTGSPSYIGIDGPATANTAPIVLTALSGATLNQDRILAAGFSTVTIGNGSGTVVLSKANVHSGAMTCSAGTTKLTHANAVGNGAGNNVTVTAGATLEVNAVKEVFPATLTLGSNTTPAIFKISA